MVQVGLGPGAHRLEGRVGKVWVAAERDSGVRLHSLVEDLDDKELIRRQNDLPHELP